MQSAHFSVNSTITNGRAITARPIIIGKFTNTRIVKAFFIPLFSWSRSFGMMEKTGNITFPTISERVWEGISCKVLALVRNPAPYPEAFSCHGDANYSRKHPHYHAYLGLSLKIDFFSKNGVVNQSKG